MWREEERQEAERQEEAAWLHAHAGSVALDMHVLGRVLGRVLPSILEEEGGGRRE